MSNVGVLTVTAATGTVVMAALITRLPLILIRRRPPIMRVKLAMDILDNCLTEPGKTTLRSRLFDPADDLDADDCIKMQRTPWLFITRLTHADECDCSGCVFVAHRKDPR